MWLFDLSVERMCIQSSSSRPARHLIADPGVRSYIPDTGFSLRPKLLVIKQIRRPSKHQSARSLLQATSQSLQELWVQGCKVCSFSLTNRSPRDQSISNRFQKTAPTIHLDAGKWLTTHTSIPLSSESRSFRIKTDSIKSGNAGRVHPVNDLVDGVESHLKRPIPN
jgi:hypothetical protein